MSVPASQLPSEPLTIDSALKRYVGLVIKIGLTIGILALLLWKVRWQEILASLSQIQAIGFAGALLLWFPNQYLQFLRWKLIAKRASGQAIDTDIRASYWLGHTLGFVTPGRIGAYGRALFLSNVPLGQAAALTVLERTYSAITVNGLGLIALGVLPQIGWHASWANWGVGVSAILIAVGSSLMLAGLIPGPLAKLIQELIGRRAWSAKIIMSLDAITTIPFRTALLYLSLAILSLFVSLVQFVLILDALGVTIPFLAGLLAVQLNFFLKGNIPLTLGNLGIGEWTALLCLRGLGVPDAQAIAASLTLFALNVALPAGIGLKYLKRVFALPSTWRSRPA